MFHVRSAPAPLTLVEAATIGYAFMTHVNGVASRQTPTGRMDQEYIVRLVGQVVRVSVETVRIVLGLSATVSLPEA